MPPRERHSCADIRLTLRDADRGALLDEFTDDGQWPVIAKTMVADAVAANPWLRSHLTSLNSALGDDGLQFAYRVFDEIACFVWRAERNGLFDSARDAFDHAVLMKVLPKFHGSRARLEGPLIALMGWCLDPASPQPGMVRDALGATEPLAEVLRLVELATYDATFRRAHRLLRDVLRDGFAAF